MAQKPLALQKWLQHSSPLPQTKLSGLQVQLEHLPVWQAWPLVQAAHAAPPVPHAPKVLPGWHTPLLSTHPLQVPPVQEPPVQEVEPAHDSQLTPPWPQAELVLPARHWPEESTQPVQLVV